MANKNELQRDKIQVDLLAALEDSESIKLDDVLEYTSPPVSYEDNQLITEGRAKQLLGSSPGSGSIISYASGTPNIGLVDDGIQVIFDVGYAMVTGVQVVSGNQSYEGISKVYQTGVGGVINGMLLQIPGGVPEPFRVDFIGQ